MLKFLKHFNPPLQQSPLKKHVQFQGQSEAWINCRRQVNWCYRNITFDNNQVVLHNCVCNYIDSLIVGELVQLILTVSWHSHSKTFFKPAVLTSVATKSYYHALSIPQTSVLDLLLNTPTKKSLKRWCQLIILFTQWGSSTNAHPPINVFII